MFLLALSLPVAGVGSSLAQASTPAGTVTGAAATAAPLSFSSSGLEGGGFQNVVARSGNVMLVGGDVSGFQRSSDGGATWAASNTGLEPDDPQAQGNPLGIAAVAFDGGDARKAYACAGSGFYVSADAGLTWSRPGPTGAAYTGPRCRPGNPLIVDSTGARAPEHPRSTGHLIAQDGGALYVATTEGGLLRSDSGGASWALTAFGPAGGTKHYLRTVVADPIRPGRVYVGTWNEGVWRLDGGAGPVRLVGGAPATMEELTVVAGTVYGVAGPAGVFKWEDGGDTWTAINGINGSNREIDVGKTAAWESIAGYVAPDGSHTLYVGCAFPVRHNDMSYGVMKSVDGGQSWDPVPGGVNAVSQDVLGTNPTRQWWVAAESPDFLIGGRTFVASQIALDPANPATVAVAGRGGLWVSKDGGAQWEPAVQHMGVTVNRSVAVDPRDSRRVYVGNTDFTVLRSGDGLSSVVPDRTLRDSNMTTAVAVDGNSQVFAASGDRGLARSASASVWSQAPTAGGAVSWDETGYATAAGASSPDGAPRPLGLAVGQDETGNEVLLVAAEGSGVWRRVAGTWRNASLPGGPMTGAQPSRKAPFSWVAGTRTVFLYDRASGVWRSTDAGATWTAIWEQAPAEEHSGYVAGDPADPDALYVSTAQGLFHLRGAASGSSVADGTIRVEPETGVPRPGPLVAASIDGVATVYAASLTNPPGLYRSANGGSSWDNVADDAYRRQAFLPHELAVAGDGRLYVALDGMGVLVGAVPTAPRPRNDSFATPTAVTGALPAVSGTTIGATKESGEGSHAGNAGGSSVWFTWRAPASGTTTITTAGSRFDTLLGVYKGTALASLVPVDSNDDTSSSDTSSTATFAAQAGTTYRIAVDGKGGASGPFTLTWAVTAKDSAFSPRTATTAGPGSSVLWAFVGPRLHSVTSSLPPFDSGPKGPGERFSFRFPAAGTFPYRSGLDGTTMTGTVAVPVVVSPARGTRTTPFLVTWASDPPPAGAVFDVRTRAPGSTTWRSWETGVTATSATFVPPPGSRTGAYSFSARLRVGAGTSGWSPTRTVQVA